MLSKILLLIGITMMYSTPLVFGALGGVISERSGVVNIGIEGMMTVGAFAAAAVSYFTGNPWLGLLAAGAAGGAIALLHAIASVTFKADQTISGIAINFIGPGLALFFCRLMFSKATMTPPAKTLPKIFGEDFFQGSPAGNLNVDVTVVLALVCAAVMWYFLYKTKWGLRVLSVGEHPAAADTLGINVSRTRYLCVLVSGVLAGFGGASMTLAIISQFTPTAISGQGFIALAAVIFGKWTPFGAYGACLLFGFAQALTIVLGGGDYAVPSQILAMLPYVLTIIVLIFFVGRSVAPKADGVPYEKGQR
ncbi:ABC transporter permease [Caproiciproducens galactitolivorans]|uniref:L-arabinose transporter permease protein n=1 Tax=Caproiciproducens galactitolivorans TaxID=642589 RepID=A0A4Z0Y8N3_9FIRM|nr:ABC transporter permease [Caproiciproducens galactitolivorans]QEY33790.1 ABC transporter permease [Caproiciproducens galactitolivorans]TGJ75631.1 L-arabinose transporter permease protein [Caproiciproducens galactitolivorans]